MSFITIICLAITAVGCGECGGFEPRGNPPSPPYGTPDEADTTKFADYYLVEYVYYCYDEQHRNISYQSSGNCVDWQKSEVRAECDTTMQNRSEEYQHEMIQ